MHGIGYRIEDRFPCTESDFVRPFFEVDIKLLHSVPDRDPGDAQDLSSSGSVTAGLLKSRNEFLPNPNVKVNGNFLTL